MAGLVAIDAENCQLNARQIQVLSQICMTGRVDPTGDRVMLFFGHWDEAHYAPLERFVLAFGAELHRLPGRRGGKDAADIALTVETVDTVHRARASGAGPPTRFALASGDADYRSLILWLRDRQGVPTTLMSLERLNVNRLVTDEVEEHLRLPDPDLRPGPDQATSDAEAWVPFYERALSRVLPGSVGVRRAALSQAADLIYRDLQNPPTLEELARVVDFHGPHPRLSFTNALASGNAIGAHGPLFEVIQNEHCRPSNIGKKLWVDEAADAWEWWAVGVLVCRTHHASHRRAIQAVAEAAMGNRSARLAISRAENANIPPAFVTQAARRGAMAPASWAVRREVIDLLLADSSQWPPAHGPRLRRGLLGPAERDTLDGITRRLVAAPQSAELDALWLAAVVDAAKAAGIRAPAWYHLNRFYFVDAPYPAKEAAHRHYTNRTSDPPE